MWAGIVAVGCWPHFPSAETERELGFRSPGWRAVGGAAFGNLRSVPAGGMGAQPDLAVRRPSRAGNLKARAGDGLTVFRISSDTFYPLPAKGKVRGDSQPRKPGVEGRGGTKEGKESQVDSGVDLRGAGMLQASTPHRSNPLPGVNANAPPVKTVLSLAKENLVPPRPASSIG